MIEGTRVVREARYPDPVELVWRALTDSAELAAWLMPNDFSAREGARFRLDSPRPRRAVRLRGARDRSAAPPALAVDRRWTAHHRHLRAARRGRRDRPARWVGTRLHRSLRPDGDATTVRFEHRDWEREDGAVASCSYTWAMILERLHHYVVDGRVDPYLTKAGSVY